MAESDADLRQMCGLIMPISAIDGCSETHWADVHQILSDAAEDAGFKPDLVSKGDEVGIIQKRIIQNLYDNPIVVCDVSGKNPNVMFELGLRLAFDKPTIIVKDDKTTYSFDTSPIEHLVYPRDLRFSRIVEFKEKLAEKIQATHKKATTDKSYTTFLKHFGEFTVAKIEKKEISGQEYILEELRALRHEFAASQVRISSPVSMPRPDLTDADINLCLNGKTDGELKDILNMLAQHPNVLAAQIRNFGNHKHITVELLNRDIDAREFCKELGLNDAMRASKLHKRRFRINKAPAI